jgi:hypothetical protein
VISGSSIHSSEVTGAGEPVDSFTHICVVSALSQMLCHTLGFAGQVSQNEDGKGDLGC